MKYIVYLASFSLLLSACGDDKSESSDNEETKKPEDKKNVVVDSSDQEVKPEVTPSTANLDLLIDDQGVGPVKLGSTLEPEDISSEYSLESKEMDLGEGETGIIKFLKSKDDKVLLSFTQDCSEGENCVADQIYVTDPSFKTSNGIGVGSTLRELNEVLTPNMAVGNEYGNVYIYSHELPNIGFEVLVEEESYPGKAFEFAQLPKESLISKVYIYREPSN